MKLSCGKFGMTARSVAVVAGLAAFSCVPSAPVLAQPYPNPQQEWEAHPNLVRAIRSMEDALMALERAPDDFGGNKDEAIRALRASIHSVKRAIFYRTRMDDSAIEGWRYR